MILGLPWNIVNQPFSSSHQSPFSRESKCKIFYGKEAISEFTSSFILNKARLSSKSLLHKSVFIHFEIRTNYHGKNFALRLALKKRLRKLRNGLLV